MTKKNNNNVLKAVIIALLIALLFFKDKLITMLGMDCKHDHFNQDDQDELNKNDPYYKDEDPVFTPPYAPENDINNDGVEDGYINLPNPDWSKSSFMKVVTDVEDFERGNDVNLLSSTNTNLNQFFNKQTGILTLSKPVN